MGCRHCVFGHENVVLERKKSVPAAITINGARRSILWSVLSQDEVSQLLLPAATFCSDAERSFERLSEAAELNMVEITGSHIAVVRDETISDANSESDLTLGFLKQKGALSVSQFVFKGGQLVFGGSENFRDGSVPGLISLVISYSNVLSRTVGEKCDGASRCTDLVRVLAQFSSYSHLALAPGCSVMYRMSLPPTLMCFREKRHALAAAITLCAGEFSQQEGSETAIWGLEQLQVFHALSDRKFERTVVAKLMTQVASSSHVSSAGSTLVNAALSVQQLCPKAFKAMRDSGKAHRLIDVRNLWEFDIASLPEARLLDAEYRTQLMSFPRDTNLVFVCHHGIRSQSAAETYSHLGFCNVYNLVGGIDAWSTLVDAAVPRY
jgi:rhodanese-related sulfurtransferase